MTVDLEAFDEISKRADGVITAHTQRDARLKKLDDVYLLRWEAPPKNPDIKLTMSPDGRNAIRGITNLLTATKPQFTVPEDENNEAANEYNETMEKFLNAAFAASNTVQMVDVEREVAHSLALYDEAYVVLTCTKDLVRAIEQRKAAGGKESWLDAHIREVAEQTPYLWECVSPRDAYPLIGRTGLMAYVQKKIMTVAECRERFGSLVSEYTSEKKATDTVEVREYWDTIWHAVWLNGRNADPFICEEHKLGFIPVAVAFGSGTRLYNELQYQRQPMLSTIIDSEVWQRKNAVLTAAFHRLNTLGLNATFVHEQGTAETEISLDFSVHGGVINVPPGGRFRLLSENLMDGNLMQALNLTDNIIEQSTVFRQALGAPVAGNDTYSTLSLLSQSGRLPLTPIQEAARKVLARSAQLVMKWIRHDEEAAAVYDQRTKLEIDPVQIPERIVFDVVLDVNLPQDMLRNANIATMLKQAELVDDKWIHENILRIGQTVNMKKRILRQKVGDTLAANMAQKYIESVTQPPKPPGPPAQPDQPATSGGLPNVQAGQLPMNEQPGGMPGEMG